MMRGTVELECGHWIVFLDSGDEPPEHGPWSLWPASAELAAGKPVTCMVHMTRQVIRTWLPGQWLSLADTGRPVHKPGLYRT